MAVNRYFERTLMPYNPIERPMPFDQLLQAGLMKQQALDRTNAAISEFQEQKMLTGGARTNTAAQQLNQEYGGKASALTDKIMSGEITPDQAAYELRNINKAYNTDAAVKQVLMDQSLMNVSNQAIINEKLRGGRAENPYYDYDSQTFRQAKLDDLRSGRDVIGADNYALLTDPGLFEDFAPIINQLHEEYFTSQGITPGTYAYDGTTGTYKLKQTGKKIGIDPDRLEQLIKNYVTAAPIEESDRMSVQYRIARGKRLGTPYTEQNLIDDLMQANIFRPWMSEEVSEDLSGLGGKGEGSTTDEDPMPVVSGELGAEASGVQYVRTSIYNINPEKPVEGMRDILTSDEGRMKAANTKLGRKGYKIKEGTTLDNPEFLYADGTPVATQDMDDVKEEFQQYKNDINFFEGVERMANEKFQKANGKTIDQFLTETEKKYANDITRWILQAPEDRLFQKSIIGDGLMSEQEEKDMLAEAKSVVPNESDIILSAGNETLLVSLDYLMPDFPTDNVSDYELRLKTFLDKNAEDWERIGSSYYMPNADRATRLRYVPIEYAAQVDTELGKIVDKYVKPAAALEFLQKNEKSVYNTYISAQNEIKTILEENNRYKVGLFLNTLEGKDGRRDHRMLQDNIRNNESLTLRASEGRPGTGEKAGGTVRDLYKALGEEVSAQDFKATAVYLNEGPDGNVQMYARMQWSPRSGTEAEGNIDELEVPGVAGKKSFRDFDVNITTFMDDFFTSDVTLTYQAASLMKDQVYTMQVGETRPVYIPSKYGPAAEVEITRFNTGIDMKGFIYGEDPNGNVIKKDVMEIYRETTGAPSNALMPIDKAAEFAGQVASSAAGVAIKHPDMFDKDGNYLGADIPAKVLDRASQVESTLETNIDALRTAMPNIDPNESNQEVIDQLKKIIGFETAGQYHPNTRNTGKTDDPTGEKATAVGLIQFYEDKGKDQIKTIGKKEYTFAELGRMSIPQQITDVVIPYLAENGSKVKTIDELYFAIFMPAFVGMDKNLTLEDAVAQAESNGVNMEGLQPGDIKASNKAFRQARTLRDILDIVENYRNF